MRLYSLYAFIIVGGLGLALATLQPVTGLFSQTFGTSGEVATAATLASPTPTATPVSRVTPSATVTPAAAAITTREPTATETLRPLSTATVRATPTAPRIVATAVAATATSTAAATRTPLATATATATATPCLTRDWVLSLRVEPQTLSLDGKATAVLVIENQGKVALPAGTALQVDFTAPVALSRLTLLGETWTPQRPDERHDWLLPAIAAGAGQKIEASVETKAVALSADLASSKSLAKLTFRVVVNECAVTREVASTTLDLRPALPAPLPVTPLPAPRVAPAKVAEQALQSLTID